MNIAANKAQKYVKSFVQKHPYWLVAGGGVVAGGAVIGVLWYISDSRRRFQLKQRFSNFSLFKWGALPPTNFTLFSIAIYNQNVETRRETIKKLLLFGAFINIIFITALLKQMFYKKMKKNRKNKIYPVIESSVTIKNPLILLIGISKYDKQKCNQFKMSNTLEGVEKDINELTNLFRNTYNYQHVYTIQEYIEQDDTYRSNYDIWAADDEVVQNFCQTYSNREKIKQLNKANKDKKTEIDGLIIYYSGHGCSNDWMFCSNGELLSFYEIKNEFQEKKCKILASKPKLFYFDCCRDHIFDKFSTQQNKWIKRRGAQTSWNSTEEINHDSTNMYTFYATANFKGNEEHTKKGGPMTNYFVEYLTEAENKIVCINKLAHNMKRKLWTSTNKQQVGEESNCLLTDEIQLKACEKQRIFLSFHLGCAK